MVGGETDDLAPAVADPGIEQSTVGCDITGTGEGREPVLEDHDIVIRGRDLAGVGGGGRAQRAGVGRRVVDPGLPMTGDAHPLAGERVIPHLGTRDHRRQVPLIDENPFRIGSLVEVDDLAAVRHAGGRAGDLAVVGPGGGGRHCSPGGTVRLWRLTCWRCSGWQLTSSCGLSATSSMPKRPRRSQQLSTRN